MPVKSNVPPGGPAAPAGRGASPALQGLGAARPQAAGPQAGGPQGHDPKQLVQMAGVILQDLAQKFGPEILDVIKQLLTGPTQGASAGPQQAPAALPKAGGNPAASPIRPPV